MFLEIEGTPDHEESFCLAQNRTIQRQKIILFYQIVLKKIKSESASHLLPYPRPHRQAQSKNSQHVFSIEFNSLKRRQSTNKLLFILCQGQSLDQEHKHQNMLFLILNLGLGSLDTDLGIGKNKAAESEPRCPAEGQINRQCCVCPVAPSADQRQLSPVQAASMAGIWGPLTQSPTHAHRWRAMPVVATPLSTTSMQAFVTIPFWFFLYSSLR